MPQSDPSVELEQTLPRSDSVLDPSAAPGSQTLDPATLPRQPQPTQAPAARPEAPDTNGHTGAAPVGDETLARPAVAPAPSTWASPGGLAPSSIDPAALGETLQPPPSQFPSASAPHSGLSAMPTRLDPVYGPPVAAPSSPVPGYEILGVLGQGGMGIVYKARQLALDRVVALKMILRGALADRESLERFRIEAHAVARLRHPNIVQIFEVGEHAGQPFFSLEYLDGGSLQQKLEGSPQAPRDAARMVELLARAVHHAHEQHIIHRDLKPANVLLDADGTPKLTDFGLAKRIEDQDQNQTGAGAVLGTPTYMAPEQAAGKTREVGPPADIYSLGAILYDLLTGRPPLRGTTLLDTLQMVRTAEPVPPRRLQPKVPADLQNICLKCLEKEPRRRYASAEALADDLHRFLDGRPTAARPVSAPERAWKWAQTPARGGAAAAGLRRRPDRADGRTDRLRRPAGPAGRRRRETRQTGPRRRGRREGPQQGAGRKATRDPQSPERGGRPARPGPPEPRPGAAGRRGIARSGPEAAAERAAFGRAARAHPGFRPQAVAKSAGTAERRPGGALAGGADDAPGR